MVNVANAFEVVDGEREELDVLGCGAMEVAWKKEEAYISRVGKVVGDEVAGSNGDAVVGSNKVSPGSNVRTDSMESIPEVGT